jgi:hypothetical protein
VQGLANEDKREFGRINRPRLPMSYKDDMKSGEEDKGPS